MRGKEVERSPSERCACTGGITACDGHIHPGQRLHTTSLWPIVLSLGICGGPRLFFVHHLLDDTYLPKVVFAEAACYPNVEIDMYGFHRGYVGYRIGIYRIF